VSYASHSLIELHGVDPALLNDADRLEAALLDAARAAHCQVLGSLKHRFSPHGASAVVLVAESHLSIHSWPEHGYAAADILTCGQTLPDAGVKALLEVLKPARHVVRRVDRGD
jgi:S-adenosylmethionine decarboxylase